MDGIPIHHLLAGDDPKRIRVISSASFLRSNLPGPCFPSGIFTKTRVREIAREQGLASADKKDSQGICFVGKVHLPVFLQQKLESKGGKYF